MDQRVGATIFERAHRSLPTHGDNHADRKLPRPSQPAPSEDQAQAAATTYTLVTEPDQGLTAIYNLIATAKKSIDMTMYELTDVTVMDAFAKAAAAGVAVRVILDESGDEKKTNTPAYNYLEQNKCGVHWSNRLMP